MLFSLAIFFHLYKPQVTSGASRLSLQKGSTATYIISKLHGRVLDIIVLLALEGGGTKMVPLLPSENLEPLAWGI